MASDQRMSGHFAIIFWQSGAAPEMGRTFYSTVESAREHGEMVMSTNSGKCDFPLGYSIAVIVEEHLWRKVERCIKCDGAVTRQNGRRLHTLVGDAAHCGIVAVKDSEHRQEPED